MMIKNNLLKMGDKSDLVTLPIGCFQSFTPENLKACLWISSGLTLLHIERHPLTCPNYFALCTFPLYQSQGKNISTLYIYIYICDWFRFTSLNSASTSNEGLIFFVFIFCDFMDMVYWFLGLLSTLFLISFLGSPPGTLHSKLWLIFHFLC